MKSSRQIRPISSPPQANLLYSWGKWARTKTLLFKIMINCFNYALFSKQLSFFLSFSVSHFFCRLYSDFQTATHIHTHTKYFFYLFLYNTFYEIYCGCILEHHIGQVCCCCWGNSFYTVTCAQLRDPSPKLKCFPAHPTLIINKLRRQYSHRDQWLSPHRPMRQDIISYSLIAYALQ